MSTDRHTTIIGADVSEYLAAKAKQRSADEAHGVAAKKLAAALDEGERDRIASMRASHDAAVRAAAGRRMDAAEARREMADARADSLAARRALAEHAAAEREAANASKRAAAERESSYRRIAALDQRMADQREAAYHREAQMIDRVAAARDAAYSRAERGAASYTATLAKQRAAESAASGAAGAVATGARTAGAVGAGIGLGVAGIKMGVDLTSQLVDESFKAQAVSRNLQLDIRGAREAMGGLVSDYDLAFAANKAYAMKVVTTGDEFAHLAGMIGEQATKLGRDSGELISEGVEAIGKQESEIADNLGVTMRLTDAYALYAEQLDKSVSSLTAKEKAEAFNKAMIIALEQATGRATVGVEGFAAAWKKTGIEIDNVRARFMKFDDMHGRANEAMRELSDEQLDRLKLAESLNDEDAKRMGSMGQTAREMVGYIDDWGLSIMDLKKHAEANGQSFLEMIEQAKAAHAAQFETAKETMLQEAQQETLDTLHEQADAYEQTGKLMQIMGASERELLEQELQILEARQMAMLTQASITKDAKDEAAAKKITQEIELTHAKIEMVGKKKGGGKKHDPNEALDLETGATLRLLDARSKVYAAELDGERSLEAVAATRVYLLSLERQALDVREQAANERTVKGAKDTDKLEAERLEILTERRLLDVEAQTLARDEGRRLAEQRLAEMDRDIAKQDALGVAVGLLEKRRASAHLAMVAEFGTAQELRTAEHDAALVQIETDAAYRESQAQAKLDAFTMEMDTAAARGEQVYDLNSRRLELEAQVAAAEDDHAKRRTILHKAELARIEERRARFERAQQATNSLMGSSVGLFEAVAASTIKNEAKREKVVLRVRGVEAVARGASETVEAVASAASYNVPQAILHGIAAATAFATGIPMIAGKVPDKGGAAATGGGAGHQTVVSEPQSSGGSGSSMSTSGSPTTPVSAEALIMRQQQGGTLQTTQGKGATVINFNGPFIAGDSGTLLHDMSKQTLKKWGAK